MWLGRPALPAAPQHRLCSPTPAPVGAEGKRPGLADQYMVWELNFKGEMYVRVWGEREGKPPDFQEESTCFSCFK